MGGGATFVMSHDDISISTQSVRSVVLISAWWVAYQCATAVTLSGALEECVEWVEEPTFVMSHDDDNISAQSMRCLASSVLSQYGSKISVADHCVSLSGALEECVEWVDEPTFVMSHDDIFNFGHSLSDFWNVWIGAELFHLPWEEMKMINMDGIRGGLLGEGKPRQYRSSVLALVMGSCNMKGSQGGGQR
jgi:hypothetical protein